MNITRRLAASLGGVGLIVEFGIDEFENLLECIHASVGENEVFHVEDETVVVAESDVLALVFVAAELSLEVLVLVVEPEVVSVDAEPQASVDIAVAFDFLVPVSVVVVEVYSSEHPKFLAFPNVYYFASSSNSVEVVG